MWPAMLLFGALTTILLAVQMDLPAEGRHRIAGGMLWLAVCFAGMSTLDRSFAGEREDGCWEALLLYPVSTTTIYFAKLAVNVVALAALQCVLVPLFAAMAGVPLLAHPGAIALTLILGILGIAAVGTLLAPVRGDPPRGEPSAAAGPAAGHSRRAGRRRGDAADRRGRFLLAVAELDSTLGGLRGDFHRRRGRLVRFRHRGLKKRNRK